MIRKAIADHLAAAVIGLGAPLFRAVGTQPGSFPRYLRQADRSGVHLRSTHFYQPVYGESDLPADTSGERDLPGLDLREGDQLALLDRLDFRDELAELATALPEGLVTPSSDIVYCFADAESLYCMLRHIRPRRLIEVGGGFSTRIAAAALSRNRAEEPGRACRHVCIDPLVPAGLEALHLEIVARRVQDIDPALFNELEAGDVLFIDSSHVIRPHGDVLAEYQRIIPSLARGVLVHVHDIFTPHDYPEAWLRRHRRLWNEQYLLEAMLAHSVRYRVVLALNWLKHHHPDRLAQAFPVVNRDPQHEPGAFWFEVVS